MEVAHTLLPMIILLFVGILAIALMRPVGLSPIIGYLIAGMVIGPHGLGLIRESETTHLLAELGVVFLLFNIGLHFSLGHLWDVRRDLLGMGPLQVIFCAAVLSGIPLMMGLEPVLAILIGATLALSSTAVVVQTVSEHNQQNCPIGTNATAVLIFQDICAIFLLILASSFGGNGGAVGSMIGGAALKAAVAFGAAIAMGRFLIGPLFTMVARLKNEEVFTAVALLTVLVTATATGMLGLSLSLGAFLGGMIISETRYRYVVQAEVKPFRGLLLGFFFITVGMMIDLELVVQNGDKIFLVLLALISLKTLFTLLAGLVIRAPLRNAIQLGFLLSQGSEFAFVIIGMPAIQAAVGAGGSSVLITAVAASMALTPLLSEAGYRIARKLACKDWDLQQAEEAAAPRPAAPVIIFGMGEIGRRIADALEAHTIPYSAIEMDYDRFVKANSDGYPVAFGDLADLRLLDAMKIAERPAIVVTIPRYEIARKIDPIVRERYPHLRRFIAVETEAEKRKYEDLGMDAVLVQSIPKGLELAAAVLKNHHVDEGAIRDWMRRHQDEVLEAQGAALG